jgi:hypothetical protein
MNSHTVTTARRRVRAASPAALLAVIPQLLGFVPDNCLVVVGTTGARSEVRLTLRYDLPAAGEADTATGLAAHAAGILAAQRLGTAVAVGYGPDPAVRPLAAALTQASAAAGVDLLDFLRVEDGRYWSITCANPACCPAEGTPFSAVAYVAALDGTAVLASRAALAESLAPASSPAMRRATADAAQAGAALGQRARASEGLAVTGALIARSRAGGPGPGDAEAARVTVALRDLRVRDDAWARMDPAHVEAHQRLWADLTRRAQPGYVAAPASLLAFTAWQAGDGALAQVALDRALADAPSYSMALLLRQVISAGAPPSLARLPMTPEEVAASYDGTSG